MATEEVAPTAQPIARLVEIAARLRAVRRAQRKFLRRWAQERSDRWLSALASAEDGSELADCLSELAVPQNPSRFAGEFSESDLHRDDPVDDLDH